MTEIVKMLDVLQERSEQTFFQWKCESATEAKRAAWEAHEAAKDELLAWAESVGLI